MKKYYIIFIVLLVIMSIVFYLLKEKKNNVKISDEEILASNNISFVLRRTTMRASNYYSFEINENGGKIDIYSYYDELESSHELEESEINLIKQSLVDYHVNTWDGFNKSDNNVLDGEMFTFEANINDVRIYASGSNAFPKGYFDFCNKLNEIIKKYDIIN